MLLLRTQFLHFLWHLQLIPRAQPVHLWQLYDSAHLLSLLAAPTTDSVPLSTYNRCPKAGSCTAPTIKKNDNIKLLFLLFQLKGASAKDINDKSFQISRKINHPLFEIHLRKKKISFEPYVLKEKSHNEEITFYRCVAPVRAGLGKSLSHYRVSWCNKRNYAI